MKIEAFMKEVENAGINFYTGVPDSQLKALCDFLMNRYGIGKRHIIAANEGNCTALATGYHLATGQVPMVYMQNSGIGNIINPAASLLSDKVYGIPCVFVVGWRGEPGIHDEPQHVFQGEVTIRLLEDMDIQTFIVTKETTEGDVADFLMSAGSRFKAGKSIAFVVKKGAFNFSETVLYENTNQMKREDIIRNIAMVAGKDIMVSTTGKASRELFEFRESCGDSHKYDFLTVGSMGHSSSIALGIALKKPNQKVWCIDGDGAALMHMGAMAVIGANSPANLVHIVINNGAHETVGGMPTVAGKINLCEIAKGCGYQKILHVETEDDLAAALEIAKIAGELVFLEVMSSIGARSDLGRPTTTAKENKENFMKYLASL